MSLQTAITCATLVAKMGTWPALTFVSNKYRSLEEVETFVVHSDLRLRLRASMLVVEEHKEEAFVAELSETCNVLVALLDQLVAYFRKRQGTWILSSYRYSGGCVDSLLHDLVSHSHLLDVRYGLVTSSRSIYNKNAFDPLGLN